MFKNENHCVRNDEEICCFIIIIRHIYFFKTVIRRFVFAEFHLIYHKTFARQNPKFSKNDPTCIPARCRAAVLRPGGRGRLPVGRRQQHGAGGVHEDPGEGDVGGRLRHVHHHELLPRVEALSSWKIQWKRLLYEIVIVF
ncbi:hypothetical protein CDAR_244141 [Caerostris darwini]|uniref:Uncharacterized protein n=1 Tax=Caerostris darwini TaxID=1538125 RepID=A0AAV4RCW6_9ARAC|nr:hypothetical protein CDAR_244141 [Caerostris darwini]